LKLYEFDGVRPENLDFNGAVAFDEEMREMMKNLHIPYLHITMEDLQERTNFVTKKIFNRWKDLKPLL